MSCNIQNTHKRLFEAHRLWHQCLENYFDPEGFRTNLNATIQSLRNLTFALQAEKSVINNFETWYAVWQTKMKKDPLLKWLNEARVQIVHQKDLETESKATVLIHSYFNLAEFKFSVPPLLPSQLIAHYSKKLIKAKVDIPEHQLKDCIAVVERRWVANDLPDWELLDVLTHSFLFMKELVIDANKQSGNDYLECSLHDTLHPLSSTELIGKYRCMDISASVRTKNIVLSNFQDRSFESKKVSMSPMVIASAKKRYLSKPIPGLSLAKHPEDPFVFADNLNKMAKVVLKRDKYHQAIQFIRIPDKGWEMRSVVAEDKSDKFLLMKELAKYVKQTKADCIIDINEAWITQDVSAINQGIPVSETKDRKEALCISVITAEGESRNYTTLFNRGYFGNIRFEETVITDGNPGYYLNPVIEVWKNEKETND